MALRKPLVLGPDGLPQQIQAGDSLDILLATPTFTETPSGLIDGVNCVFVLSHTPVTLLVFLNGLAQRMGTGNDYQLSGDTIVYDTAPSVGDTLYAEYTY